jgi:hypothetical protein
MPGRGGINETNASNDQVGQFKSNIWYNGATFRGLTSRWGSNTIAHLKWKISDFSTNKYVKKNTILANWLGMNFNAVILTLLWVLVMVNGII